MGSSNVGTNEVRRRIQARDAIVNALPNSRHRPTAETVGQRRGGQENSKGNLALSGRTTTSKGYTIVPPTRAKIIAFEFEQVPSDHNSGIEDIDDVNIPGEKEFNETYNSVGKHSVKTVQTNDDAGYNNIGHQSGQKIAYAGMFTSSGKSKEDNSNKKHMDVHVKESSSLRTDTLLTRHSRTNSRDRSISPTPPLSGNVTGSKSEVSSQIAALREEYEVRKRGRSEAIAKFGKSDEVGSQSKLGRRRREKQTKAQVPQLDNHTKQAVTVLPRKSGATLNALGNNNNGRQRKFSPYLPAYIQPFVEERPSYRAQHNSMLYQGDIASQRNRKISTDMNRYDSSTSSSTSSSTDSENESPTRRLVVQSAVRAAKTPQLRTERLETPDTSDAEKRRPEGRRRRTRRPRASANDADKGDAIPHTRAQVISQRTGISTRTRVRANTPAVLDDKYVTLPDNYKQSEFYPRRTDIVTVTSSTVTAKKDSAQRGTRFVAEKSAAGDKGEVIQTKPTSSSSRNEGGKTEMASQSKANRLIISAEQRDGYERSEKSERLVGQASPPTNTSYSEHQLSSTSSISEHVDLTVSSPDLNDSSKSPPRSLNTADELINAQDRSRRSSSTGSESKTLGSIKSVFESSQPPTGDFGQSFAKKEKYSQGSNVNRVTRASAHDNFDNGVVQSQPKIKARKVGEDFWPRDEATQLLLSRNAASASTSPTASKDYDKVSLTMQETIDQLHKFADNETHVYKSKSRSNSNAGLSDLPKSDRIRSQSVDATTAQADGSRSHSHPRGSYPRSGVMNLSKVQMVKISPLDMSPCVSSTETLKDFSSGEYQGKNSRSHSIDSITSAPEGTVHKTQVSQGTKANCGTSPPHINSELLITEGHETSQDGIRSPNRSRDVELVDTKQQSESTDDLTTMTAKHSNQKSMLMQMQELTASLRKFKLAGPAQPLTSNSANWQKAIPRTDPILSVHRGNVMSVAPHLETLSEHPEPQSPQIKTKRKQKSVQGNDYIRKPSDMRSLKASEDSLDIDEGIVTEEEVVEDPQSFLKLEEKLDELNKRRKRGPQQTTNRDAEASNGNESARSLSDPMSNRKRSSPEETSVDSNLLGSLQAGKPTMGLFDQNSASSVSVLSSSMYGDSTNADDLTNESPSLDEDIQSQPKPSKKKSFSDPNPDGVINHGFNGNSEAIQESEFHVVHSASSEPNVMEQNDQLGDLDQFKIYHSTKVMSEAGIRRQERGSNDAQPLDELTHLSQRSNRKNVNMKARLRAENEAMRSGKSMISQLLASRDVAQWSDQQQPVSSSSPTGAYTVSSPTRKMGPETLLESEEQFLQMYDSMTSRDEDLEHRGEENAVHHRSNSEPVSMKAADADNLDDFEEVQSSFNRGRRPGIIQAPSLDNVGNRYATEETRRSDVTHPQRYSHTQHSQSMDGVYSTSLPSKGDYYLHTEDKRKPDMRLHAFRNLLETEESYVSSLKILYQDYMTPLKHPENHSTCEPRLVDEMFYKIPQLYQHHERFYESIKSCYAEWNNGDVRLGDLFLSSFNKDALLETYTAYIKNYLNAREAVRTAKAKAAFRLFIEKCQLENKDKQGLGDLMIKPVQRIPRYELIIKDLLKHTPESHQDRDGLLIAQREIHTLAVQMNHGEKEAEAAEKHDRLLADIEQLIEGCVDLCVPKRQFLRQDIVAELKGGNKKDRSLWLFNDLIVCTTAKKGRTGSFRRSSMNLWSLGQDKLAIDFTNKYKFLWKFPLEDVEHLKGSVGMGRMSVDKQLQVLQNDFEILTNMNKLAVEIVTNHVQLDEALKEITTYVSKQIVEKRQFQTFSPPGRIELGITTGDGVKTFLFEFLTEDTKVQFERLFANVKRSLTTQKNQWEPAFMKAIPISKTRAGMQFSCAAPNVDSFDVREVWVCNTDGYVGQVCFLNLESEPNQTQCITVCHAKICCIAQVPAWERRLVPASMLLQEISKGPLAQPANGRRHSSSASNPALAIMSWDDQDDSDEDNTSPVSTMDSHSSYNSPYSTNNSTHNYDNLQAADLATMPGFPGPKSDQNGGRFREGVAWKKDSDGSTVHGSLEDLLADGEAMSGAAQSILAGKDSMWLGTEDGKIHIYPSSESVRGAKHCVRLRHSAAVHCILYHDGQVFVALSNGDLVIYFRNLTTGEWDFENQKTKSKVSTPHAITKMVVVGQKELWCGCQNLIRIIDTKDHVEADRFSITNDNKRQIYCMAHCGYGVWIALDKRPQIKLFHAITHEQLTEIDVSNAVNKMLASADAIIRQHKAACLRITALLVCKDLLWVGTSAGVVLTLSLPKITERTSSLPLPLMPTGLAYGHTGHVRFLTAAEIPDKDQQSLSRGGSRRSSATANKRRMSSTSSSGSGPRTVSVIISGGDGYEDFRMNSASESAGREDSTNHLLVWRA